MLHGHELLRTQLARQRERVEAYQAVVQKLAAGDGM